MRRKKLDEYYAWGARDGMKSIPPDPVRMDKHLRMAYDAGWAEGRRERAKCETFIRETCGASERPAPPPLPPVPPNDGAPWRKHKESK